MLAVSSQMHKCILREGWEWKLKEQLFAVLCVGISIAVWRRCCEVKIFPEYLASVYQLVATSVSLQVVVACPNLVPLKQVLLQINYVWMYRQERCTDACFIT